MKEDQIRMERTFGDCACDGCGERIYDINVMVMWKAGIGATICDSCMGVVAEYCVKNAITTTEELRLRKEIEDLRHAMDCDRDVNEARIAAEAEVERLRERVRELGEEVTRLSETVSDLKSDREKLVNRLSAEGLFEDWMDFNY